MRIPFRLVDVFADAPFGGNQLCVVPDTPAELTTESLYLFAIRGDGDLRARMFDKGTTIGEDPATGSAAGPLGVYLALHGVMATPGSVVVAQGEQVGRPSFLRVHVDRDADRWVLDVAGGVRPWGDGAFEI